MNIEEYNQRLTELIGLVSGDLAEDTVLVSGAELLRSIKERIAEGKNSDDATMRPYSEKPIYVTPKQFAKTGAFNAQGKQVNEYGVTIGDRLIPSVRLRTDQLKKERVNYKTYTAVKPDYKPRKSMYLDEGYKELRDIQGLRTDIVNLNYRGDLIKSYQLFKESQAVILGLNSELSKDKRSGLTTKFGEAFVATQKEQDTYIRRTNFLLNRIIRDTLVDGNYVTATIS